MNSMPIGLPDGGECELNLWGTPAVLFQLLWYDPRTGRTVEGGRLEGHGRRKLGPPPLSGDVVARITRMPANR